MVYPWTSVASIEMVDGKIVGVDGSVAAVLASQVFGFASINNPIAGSSSPVGNSSPGRVVAVAEDYPVDRQAGAATFDLVAFASWRSGQQVHLLLNSYRDSKLVQIADIEVPADSNPTDLVLDAGSRLAYLSTTASIFVVDISEPMSGTISARTGRYGLDPRVVGVGIAGASGVEAMKVSRDGENLYVGDTAHGRLLVVNAVRPKKDLELSFGTVAGNGFTTVDRRGRVFPDANDSNENFNDALVVKATLTENPRAGVTVYFEAVDVDDPSSDDPVIDPNGSAGGDNSTLSTGRFVGANAATPMLVQAVTDDQGVAAAPFQVQHQPGDNYVFFAALEPSHLGTAKASNSQEITVWRKLRIEHDMMATPTLEQNSFTVGLTSVIEFTEEGFTLLEFDEIQRPWWFPVGSLTDGIAYVDGQPSYFGIESDGPGFVRVSAVGIPTDSLVVTLTDDDMAFTFNVPTPTPLQMPIDMRAIETGTGEIVSPLTDPRVVQRFAAVYLEPELVTAESGEVVPFFANLDSTHDASGLAVAQLSASEGVARTATISSAFRQTQCTDPFWSIYVVSAYQSGNGTSYDPNSGTVSAGEDFSDYFPGKTTGAYFYHEAVRDRLLATGKPFHEGLWNTVIHEIGHEFGLLDNPDYGLGDSCLSIMTYDARIDDQRFCPGDIAIVKSSKPYPAY